MLAVQQAMSGYMTSVNDEATAFACNAFETTEPSQCRSGWEQDQMSLNHCGRRDLPQQVRSNSLPGIPNNISASLQANLQRRQSLAINMQSSVLNPEDAPLIEENFLPKHLANKQICYNIEAQSTYYAMNQTQKCAVLIDMMLMNDERAQPRKASNVSAMTEGLDIMSEATTPSMATAFCKPKSQAN